MVATTRNGLVLPTVGGERDTWGANLNDNNFTLLDASLDGWTTLTTTGGAVVLTATGAVANQARERVLFTSAARTSAVTIVIPTVEKWYFVANYGSGSNLFIGTSGGNTVTCAANAVTTVICNGSATSNAGQGSLDNITGPSAAYSFNGQRLTSLGTGTASTDGTSLGQVTSLIANAVTPVGGGAVRVTVADTVPAYLSSKVTGDLGISATVSNAASNETLVVSMAGLTYFRMVLTNSGGSLYHRIGVGVNATTSGAYVSTISGATPTSTLTATGTDSSTAFTAGLKVGGTLNFSLIFNTANQSDTRFWGVPNIDQSTVSTALTVAAVTASANVNGTTLNYFQLRFFEAVTGSSFALTPATMASGSLIAVSFNGYLA